MTLPVKEPWAIVATSLRVVREAVFGHARAERACQNACRAQAWGAEVRSATATTRVDAQQIRASARSARLARWIDGDEWRREQSSGRVPPDLMERWVGAVRTMDAIVLEAFSKRIRRHWSPGELAPLEVAVATRQRIFDQRAAIADVTRHAPGDDAAWLCFRPNVLR